MITLYGIPRSRTMRALWMLEELGLPYENVKVSFVDETRTPAFLKLNPNGHIPVLQDGDLTLWESMVTFTVADLNVASVISSAPLGGLDLRPAPYVLAWVVRCTERPAFARVMELV